MAVSVPDTLTAHRATPITTTLEEETSHISDSMYSNIVRIIAHTTDFDFKMPFKIDGTATFSGTGFFINDRGDIMTCAHVVSEASHVYIEIPSEGKRQYSAKIMGVCPFFDLAIIHVEDYNNSSHCELDERLRYDGSDLVQSGDETLALGFPLGQDNLKVTRGIISGQQLRMYQIDTPINHGNSGGPLLKNGKVIGINGAGMMFANNIGYAVPISRYYMIEKELHKPKNLIHFPEVFGFEYQLTSKELLDFYGYGNGHHASEKSLPGPSGVCVKKVFKGSPIHKCSGIKAGTVISSINGISIDNYGEFDKRWMRQKMTWDNILCTLALDQNVTVGYYPKPSAGKANSHFHTHEFVLKADYKMPVRHMYSVFEEIPYEVIAGIVVMPLTLNHLKHSLAMNMRGLSTDKYKKVENRHKARLIISSVLMGSYISTLHIVKESEIITHVNNIEVGTVEEFRDAVRHVSLKNGKYFIELKTENKNIVVLPVERILAEEGNLQSVYKYAPSAIVSALESIIKKKTVASKKPRLSSNHTIKVTTNRRSKAVLNTLRTQLPS
jgi:S1-C subfamily serine protease